MAGCGEQPPSGRWPYMDKESDHQGPESSDDRSAADFKESLEYSPKKLQAYEGTVFTEEQLNALEALFKNKPHLRFREREQLADQLSLPDQCVKIWLHNRRLKEKNQKKLAHQGPESSDDRSAAPHEENPEHPLENIQVWKKTVKAQLDTLEALFKKKQHLTPTELEQLASHFSLPQQSIESWFQKRRAKMKHEALTSQPESKYNPNTGSKTATQDQPDLQHKQNKDDTKNVVQAQKQSYLDMFPPPLLMDSYALPQEPHSSNMAYCQNADGPTDSRRGTEVCKMPPESDHNAYVLDLSLPNKTKPKTSIWTPESSFTTDLTFYDELSLCSAPSTPQMPIAWDDAGSSPVTSLLTGDEATDSD